jgi:hypothetical protein
VLRGQHFQHLPWSVNYNYFIPNVIGGQACWFVCKIRLRLAASGAPAVVKRRAVDPVHTLKILPVIWRGGVIWHSWMYNITFSEGNNPSRLMQMSKTRWSSTLSVIFRIAQKWVDLRTHFKISRLKEWCHTAEILHEMVKNNQNYEFPEFPKPIFKKCKIRIRISKRRITIRQNLRITLFCWLLPGKTMDTVNTKVEEHLDPKSTLDMNLRLKCKALVFLSY